MSHWLYSWFGSRPEDLQRAEEASRRALELAPELAETHVARAATLALTRRFDEAAVEFEAAIERNPQLWEAYWLYGRMRFAQGRADDAERLWKQAMAVRPEDYQIPILISMIYEAAAVRRTSRRRNGRASSSRGGSSRASRGTCARCTCAPAPSCSAAAREEGLRLLDRVLSLAAGRPVGPLQRRVRVRERG